MNSALLSILLLTAAVDVSPFAANACVDITDAAQRLACYDTSFRRRNETSSPLPGKNGDDHDTTEASQQVRTPLLSNNPTIQTYVALAPESPLSNRWELDDDSKQGTFHIRAYKPVYLMPVFYASNVNRAPSSPAPGHSLDIPEHLKHAEAKFQLSLKTKAWQGVFGDIGDLWIGYTQVSHWQVDNPGLSRPFRETNYEPEALLVFATDFALLGWHSRLLGVGVNHQSNGRSLPLSRSWNRMIVDIGFERPGWVLMLRPWWRISEDRTKDDNPDIPNYIGRGDLQLTRLWNGHEFDLMLRHTLRGNDNRGALQLDWAFPIKEELRGHVQVFDGYGESLVDYNHRATYFGLGLSLLEWY